MHDPAMRVRRFEAERKPAVRIAVEPHAEPFERRDGRRGRRGKAGGNAGIAKPIGGGKRVRRVRFRRVVLAQRRSDSALRPGRRSTFGKRLLRDQHDRSRRKIERRHQSGEPAADDDRHSAEVGADSRHRFFP